MIAYVVKRNVEGFGSGIYYTTSEEAERMKEYLNDIPNDEEYEVEVKEL